MANKKIKKDFLENTHILDIHEASLYTKLSTSYLYKLVARKEVPHSRAGYKILFNKFDLDKWLDAKSVVVS
jgi:excisionase family DNA binding protein